MKPYYCKWCESVCEPTGRMEDELVLVKCQNPDCDSEQWHPAPDFGADHSYITDPRWEKFNDYRREQAWREDG
jgi:hypothetical protein